MYTKIGKALYILCKILKNMKIQREIPKIKLDLKITEEFLSLKIHDKNPVIQKLEENMKLREMKIEKHIEKELRQAQF